MAQCLGENKMTKNQITREPSVLDATEATALVSLLCTLGYEHLFSEQIVERWQEYAIAKAKGDAQSALFHFQVLKEHVFE